MGRQGGRRFIMSVEVPHIGSGYGQRRVSPAPSGLSREVMYNCVSAVACVLLKEGRPLLLLLRATRSLKCLFDKIDNIPTWHLPAFAERCYFRVFF